MLARFNYPNYTHLDLPLPTTAELSATYFKMVHMACYQINVTSFFVNDSFTFMSARRKAVFGIFSMIMNPNFADLSSNNSFIFLNEPNHLPSHVSDVINGAKEKKVNLFSYQRQELNLLPYPYKTQCRDYTKENYLNQDHCIYETEN